MEDTFQALQLGAVETLILWDSLDITRFTLKNTVSGATVVRHLTKTQEAERSNFIDKENGAELETVESISLLEWVVEFLYSLLIIIKTLEPRWSL